MPTDEENQVDELQAWAATTQQAMTGVSGELKPLRDVFPLAAGQLERLARETIEEALGHQLSAHTPVALLCRPGRIRVCVGSESYETEASGDLASLQQAVISASHALAVARTEYF